MLNMIFKNPSQIPISDIIKNKDMIELFRELAMYTHESNTTHEFFNLKSTIIGKSFSMHP